MKSIVRFAALFVLMATFTSLPAAAQNAVQRNCDSGCGGAIPTGGPISFITGPNAGRGTGSLRQPSFPPFKSTRGGEVTVEGSQSFNYSVSLVSISGLNGLGVNLTLCYNLFIC